jgi:hypothetical protein
MIFYNHSGNLGDAMYSLLFATEFAEKLSQDFEYNLQINQKATYTEEHPYGDVMLTHAAADFLKPLLMTVCKDVTVSEDDPPESFDLSAFRRMKLNFCAGSIQLWYYQLVNCSLPMDLSRKILDVEPSEATKDKVVVIKSSRYNNVFFSWKDLEEFKDRMVFIGLDEEHDAFCNSFFNIERLPVKDALEAARAIAGAKLTIGNPSGLFSIAEMMKTPRCLVTAEFLRWQDKYVIPRTMQRNTSRRRSRNSFDNWESYRHIEGGYRMRGLGDKL